MDIENVGCGAKQCSAFDPWDQYEDAVPENAGASLETLNTLLNRGEEILHKRMPNYELETGVPDEMKVICQPRGKELADLHGYAYDATAGSGSTIYIIDSGFTPTEEVSLVCGCTLQDSCDSPNAKPSFRPQRAQAP